MPRLIEFNLLKFKPQKINRPLSFSLIITDLRLRVIEHNIYTLSGYYSRITTTRLAQMLDLTEDEAESRLCEMVTGSGLAAKVDRPAGIIRFGARQGQGEALNKWSGSISKLLTLVEKTCQQIQKESQVYKVPLGPVGMAS